MVSVILSRRSAVCAAQGDMFEHYRKLGTVVRREGNVLLRIDEAGEAIDDGTTFTVRPIAHEPLPRIDERAVVAAADRLATLSPERLIVSEGVAEHECDGRTWREESRRVHIALTHGSRRVLVDHADFAHLDAIEEIVRALRDAGEREVERVRLAPPVAASLLTHLHGELEQRAGGVDGRGNPVEQRVAKAPHPNVFRPSYRVKPLPAAFNLAAVPFGEIDATAPLAIALVDGTSLLCVDGDAAFITPLRSRTILAAGEPQRWFPHGAGAFGAELLL